MSRNLSASERSSLVRLASTLPVGSSERKALLASLLKVSSGMEFRLLKMSGNNVMAQISGKPPIPQNRQVGDVVAILNFIGGSAGSEVDSRVAQFVMSWAKNATPGEEIFVEDLGGKWVVT